MNFSTLLAFVIGVICLTLQLQGSTASPQDYRRANNYEDVRTVIRQKVQEKGPGEAIKKIIRTANDSGKLDDLKEKVATKVRARQDPYARNEGRGNRDPYARNRGRNIQGRGGIANGPWLG